MFASIYILSKCDVGCDLTSSCKIYLSSIIRGKTMKFDINLSINWYALDNLLFKLESINIIIPRFMFQNKASEADFKRTEFFIKIFKINRKLINVF